MKSAAEYLAWVEALIVDNPCVEHWEVIRKEAQGDAGLFRYRLQMSDGTMVEMLERFMIMGGRVEVTKYSFHWQGPHGDLIRRWDNAPHHPEVASHPHHVHHGDESNVLPHHPMCAHDILNVLCRQAGSETARDEGH